MAFLASAPFRVRTRLCITCGTKRPFWFIEPLHLDNCIVCGYAHSGKPPENLREFQEEILKELLHRVTAPSSLNTWPDDVELLRSILGKEKEEEVKVFVIE